MVGHDPAYRVYVLAHTHTPAPGLALAALGAADGAAGSLPSYRVVDLDDSVRTDESNSITTIPLPRRSH